MKTRTFVNAIALAVLLGSVAANAATDLDALQACSDAVAAEIGDAQDATVRVRIDETGIRPERVLRDNTIFHLDAVDASTNELVGRFDCVVNRRAKVRTLRMLAADAPPAELRNRG